MNCIILFSVRWTSLAVVWRINGQGEEASEGGRAWEKIEETNKKTMAIPLEKDSGSDRSGDMRL